MTLNLKVPVLEEKPLIIAETREQKVAEFISNLPMSKLNESAVQLLDELEILNRQKVNTETRIKALEAYRPAVINFCESLSATYSNATLPLSQIAIDRASIAQSLWTELGYGYKLALLDMQNQFFGKGNGKSIAFVIIRAIDAATQLSLAYYQTYFAVPSSVWSDVHQIYLFAVQQSLHELEIEAGHPYFRNSSINLAYKQLLLLALSDPQHLSAQDTAMVSDYIARHAKHAQLQGLGVVENLAGIFLVSLNSSNPPIPYLKVIKPTDGSTDILMLTVGLARVVHQHIQTLQAKTPINPQELPENAQTPRYMDMLVHLIKHWGTPPKRVFNRSRKVNATDIGVGLSAAHYLINQEKMYVQPDNSFKTLEITAGLSQPDVPQSSDSLESTRWQVVNISAGGLALRKTPATDGKLRVGEILCLKNPGDPTWSVGVLRWASNGDKQQLDIGAQLIAPSAIAGGARSLNQGKFEPILILPAISALKQDVSVIASCGTYSPARILELDEHGKISRVMITRLVERTGSFERFLFSYL